MRSVEVAPPHAAIVNATIATGMIARLARITIVTTPCAVRRSGCPARMTRIEHGLFTGQGNALAGWDACTGVALRSETLTKSPVARYAMTRTVAMRSSALR